MSDLVEYIAFYHAQLKVPLKNGQHTKMMSFGVHVLMLSIVLVVETT